VVVDRLIIRKARRQDGYEGYEESRPVRKVAERPTLYDVNAGTDGTYGTNALPKDDEALLASVQEPHEEVDAAFRQRLADSLETTLKLGNGVVLVSVIDSEEILFSEKAACVYCGISLPEIAPRSFSFNSPHGACPTCTGLGTQLEIDPELIVTHPTLSLNQGAIAPWSKVVNGSQIEK